MTASGAEKRISKYEELRITLPAHLPAYLARQRWFGGKARHIHSAELVDLIPLQTGELDAFILLVRVNYQIGSAETYVLPMVSTSASNSRDREEEIYVPGRQGGGIALADALGNDLFLSWLLDAIEVKLVSPGIKGEIRACYTDVLQNVRSHSSEALQPKLLKGEQSNSSIVYGNSLILKCFRRFAEGTNPDQEIGLFLTEKACFPHIPPLAGWLEYRGAAGTPSMLGLLQGFVPNQGDAWRFTLAHLDDFWAEVFKRHEEAPAVSVPSASVLQVSQPISSFASKAMGPYLETVELLGKRTAELHLALASDSSDAEFAPAPYTAAFQSDFSNSVRELTDRNLFFLQEKRNVLPRELRAQADDILRSREEILRQFQSVGSVTAPGLRIRIHGDYHLGQVLYTGTDFVIIDFEGEPARPLEERRRKRSPLQDVAGMVRSFHYAAFARLLAPVETSSSPTTDAEKVAGWAEHWYSRVTARFLKSYFATAASGSFLAPRHEDCLAMLQVYLLEKAVYELGYELNNRPGWVGIPLAGISRLLGP